MTNLLQRLFIYTLCLWVAGPLMSPPVWAQTATLLPNAIQQFFKIDGKPVANGKVEHFVPNTSTGKTVWQDSGESTPWPQVIPLNSGGFPTSGTQPHSIYGDGTYRQVVKDANGLVVWDQVTSSTGGSGSGGGGSATVGDGDAVGTIKPWAGMIAPVAYQFTYGQALPRNTFPEAFTAITSLQSVSCTSGVASLTGLVSTENLPLGAPVESSCVAPGTTVVSKGSTTVTLSSPAIISGSVTARFFPYGNGNGSTTFNLPDLRDRYPLGRGNMGGIAALRVNTPFFGAPTNALGATGGTENKLISQDQLPNIAPTFTGTPNQGLSVNTGDTNIIAGGIGGTMQSGGSTQGALTGAGFNANVRNSTGVFTATGSISSINGGVSQQALSVMSPAITTNYIIKVTPDSNPNSFFGVASIGGMTGVLTCGSGMICAGGDISVAPGGYILPPPTALTLGGLYAQAPITNQFLTSIGTTGAVTLAQPSFGNLSGSIAVGQIPDNSLSNSKLAFVPAATLKGNPTNATANPSDFTIQSLPDRGSPDPANDKIMLLDAATGTFKYVTPNNIASAGVAGVASIGSVAGIIGLSSDLAMTGSTLGVVTGVGGNVIPKLSGNNNWGVTQQFNGGIPISVGTGGTGTTSFNSYYNGQSGAGGGIAQVFQKNSTNLWAQGFVSSLTGAGTSNDYAFYNFGLGTQQLTLPAATNGVALAASAYMNYGTTYGAAGYGFRDLGGVMQYKNSGGAWTAFTGDVCIVPIGADPTGVADSSPAFQTAFNAVAAAGKGCVRAPAGDFKLNSLVTIGTDIPFGLFGAGQGVTNFMVNNGTGGIAWYGTMTSATIASITFRDFDIVAASGGLSGTGITMSQALAPQNPTWIGSTEGYVSNVRCRSTTPNAATERFGTCFLFENFSGLHLDSATVYQLYNNATIGFHVNNGSYNAPSGLCCIYEMNAVNMFVQGGGIGLQMNGWIEGVRLTAPSFIGTQTGVYFAASGAISPTVGPPFFVFTDGEFNSANHNILMDGVSNVKVLNSNFYKTAEYSDNVDTASIILSNVDFISMIGNTFECVRSSVGNACGPAISNSSRVLFNDNTIAVNGNGWAGLYIASSSNVQVSGNNLKTIGSIGSTNGIAVVNTNVAGITNNMIQGWAASISAGGSCINTTGSAAVFGGSLATNGCY